MLQPLVSADWLAQNLENPKLIVLEVVLNKKSEAVSKIPNSMVFNIDLFSLPESNLPHMMPSPEMFGAGARKLGINQDSMIVVYDEAGIYSSPRAWFMFRAMGLNNIAVLDGGLPAWKEKGFQTVGTSVQKPLGNFQPQLVSKIFCDANEIDIARKNKDFMILDARSEGRFYAREPEPRSGLRSGHIPNSSNLPYTKVLDGIFMKPQNQLIEIFDQLLMDRKNVITSCGSGVTACIIGLAAIVSGFHNVTIYDGSWTEWAQDLTRPIEQ